LYLLQRTAGAGGPHQVGGVGGALAGVELCDGVAFAGDWHGVRAIQR